MTWQELKHSKLAWSSSNLSKLTLTLILGVLPRKKMFYPETALCVYLRAKFQVSSLILSRPRRGDFTPSPLLSPQNEHLKSPHTELNHYIEICTFSDDVFLYLTLCAYRVVGFSSSLSEKYNLITREVDKVFALLSKIEKDTF